MASVTLVESAKLALDDLVAGVIENVITVNRMYEMIPFDGISGNALAYNRENALGDVQVAGVDTTITAKAPATFTKVTSELTTIIGDAEVNGLIQATRSSDGNDQTAIQVASKAKSCGRKFQDMLINGTGANDEFEGLINLVASGQTLGNGTNGAALSFEKLDELLDTVTDKDGEVDYLTMHARTLRSFNALLRALGGASIGDVVTLPSGAEVPAYRGVPIFRNDYIPTNQTVGTSSNCTTVFAGTFDDGSRTHGIAGLTAEEAAGIQVEDVGPAETKDNYITRVKWYCGLALFSEKGLAALPGVTN
ncbi:major head protein [Pseudomonas phage vB_PaeS_PAO1_Ab19]|uniref:major head protein n=1 Tax=Pseudomonas phage vB_PaeS_PAO1_Ab19 TaxID=1548912 RepID=UPI0018AFBD57|nr:major head protein [Pseudomonas phage vB_PaeS_PAO1_Ab19]